MHMKELYGTHSNTFASVTFLSTLLQCRNEIHAADATVFILINAHHMLTFSDSLVPRPRLRPQNHSRKERRAHACYHGVKGYLYCTVFMIYNLICRSTFMP